MLSGVIDLGARLAHPADVTHLLRRDPLPELIEHADVCVLERGGSSVSPEPAIPLVYHAQTPQPIVTQQTEVTSFRSIR
jgi:hypothetical protein